MIRLRITVAGIVQGVGFRPFVYHLAKDCQLTGFVFNHSGGVTIEIEGEPKLGMNFLCRLKDEIPPLAVLDSIEVAEIPVQGDAEFVIRTSMAHKQHTALVSPDVAVCEACVQELTDTNDRRYRYPFINCTNCGPRYTIIRDIPYDRLSTTMAEFSLCNECQQEYDNPLDRRFHAQPNACEVCGPSYQLLDREGREIKATEDIFLMTRRLIMEGSVIAMKGIGGYHLVCNAFDRNAVQNLRQRKIREDKPFAVMCGSEETVSRLAKVSLVERQLLTSMARPIVLLAKSEHYGLAEEVAPGNSYIGIMLPYAPVHYLLLAVDDAWVMTSGNTSDEPIIYEDEAALKQLNKIADYFLIHNRAIYRRADDSVARIFQEKPYFIRRSRGYVPKPIILRQYPKTIPPVLALGGELKNTFCLTRENQAFLSTHIGDLENLQTFEYYQSTIEHFEKLLDTQPEVIAYDLHPEYLSTKFALTSKLPKLGIQHHHAHIASVLAEHGITEKVIGVSFDGTGYGPDGTLWGGEFLVADCRNFERAGHIKTMPLPGGQRAIKEPWRLAIWMLYNLYGKDFIFSDACRRFTFPSGGELLLQAIHQGMQFPLSSSAGRLFDTAAALLGIRHNINYEGQAAIELEFQALKGNGFCLPYEICPGSPYILNFDPAFLALIEAVIRGESIANLAAAFHTTLACAVRDIIVYIRKDTKINKVALSGGVWQNITLLKQVIDLLEQEGFLVYLNQQVPTNDGGISLGQTIIAWERLR